MSTPNYVSTQLVAEALGVSVSTVKRWVDDGVLKAHRTAGGHRKLLSTDVLRLADREKLPRVDLTRLAAAGVNRQDPSKIRRTLRTALRDGNEQKVRALLARCSRQGMPMARMADQIIAPAMAMIGREWDEGVIDILHEHRATLVCSAALTELKANLAERSVGDRPIAVGCSPERDFYSLPTLLAEMILLEAGWKAINLGPNTPFESLRKAIDEFQPRLVWLSVSHLDDAEQFAAQYLRWSMSLRDRPIAIALGGQALTAELRSRLPCAMVGDRLSQLSDLADTLYPNPKTPKRGRPAKKVS